MVLSVIQVSMKKLKKQTLFVLAVYCFFPGLTSCLERAGSPEKQELLPALFPDYAGVTIPASIAPLNFTVKESFEKIQADVEDKKGFKIKTHGKKNLRFPPKQWRKMLAENRGAAISITVSIKKNGRWLQYRPFPVYISEYPIDEGLVYRLIAPGYETYSKMGIYYRSLSDFKQTAILENTLVTPSCINCHSFRQTFAGDMSLHVRGEYGGTILKNGGQTVILNLKTDGTLSTGVYPYWHPQGKYIAYSTNHTQQAFHSAANERIEVVDSESDIIIYDIENCRILSPSILKTENLETFPSFSADGKSLFFCLSTRRNLPAEYKEIRYNLCRIDFDPATGTFGKQIDTLVRADTLGKSISFARPSYDGRYIMYTLSDYGNFSIWHKEADLWLLNLQTGERRPLHEVNSPDTESYHCWSSNSRWFAFSSRRIDGLYTRPYIASLDENGNATKPFLLPQENPNDYYIGSLYSFNIPEFINGTVHLDIPQLERQLISSRTP
jgi:hypothetical protein